MAIHRGIQSAVFWYASCAPCTEAKYRKQRKKEAERGRLDREALAVEIPNMYRHPSPSATNPHWQTEIDAGPVLVGRRWKGYAEDPRKRGGAGKSGSAAAAERNHGGSDRPSLVDLGAAGEGPDGRNDSKSDFKRYQRDDDELWGSTSTERLGFSRSWQSSGVTVPARAYTRGSDGDGVYASYGNPQINDLHPATVTKINSRNEARWMFQPPPHADVMLGKTRAPRSRSGSGNSSRVSAKSSVPLSRDVSQRMMERRIRNGEASLAPSMSRGSSALSANELDGSQRDMSTIEEKDFAGDEASLLKERTQSLPPPLGRFEDSEDSTITVIHGEDPHSDSPERIPNRKAASRPQLSTIISESVDPSDRHLWKQSPESTKENDLPGLHHSDKTLNDRDRVPRKSPLGTMDESLRVLQELAPASRIFKTQLISPDELVRASKKSSRMPSQDAAKDRTPEFDPDIFESWDRADFALPEWIHEHTKREVKERWSMDI